MRRTSNKRFGYSGQALRRAGLALCAFLFATPLFAQEATDQQDALTIRRNATEAELRDLARTIAEAKDKAAQLEASIAGIERTTSGLREALVSSAAKRKDLEQRQLDSQTRLAGLTEEQAKIKTSLRGRRAVLGEVLAALERMGRNPPPALLVTPDDALSSVRSAIMLGAVVPGIRAETDKLIFDLTALSKLRDEIATEQKSYVTTMAAALEEERRMQLLIAENARLEKQNRADLESERKRAAELASRATSLESLIGSLERDIASAREAAEQARKEEERRNAMTPADRAREEANPTLPDKNRIAPAYAFSTLKAKLDLPVAGTILRRFGEADGTGHEAQGIMIGAGPGLVVTAPSDGWVVFAGPFRSYGQMVILNAGDGYHLVIAGMETVSTRQGQFVVAGEPIGQMGAKRIASAAALNLETERPTLYIEFRKDGKPVDSEPWWAIQHVGKARNDT
ncbi:murein hydrolase activator EnvC family protein [Rhizobium alvei]|uniref:murein hydrolase activator EnvC family protein n=1 Tax=Rhizobium alvei TaxID=1132659 RepID=UPI00361F81A6